MRRSGGIDRCWREYDGLRGNGAGGGIRRSKSIENDKEREAVDRVDRMREREGGRERERVTESLRFERYEGCGVNE